MKTEDLEISVIDPTPQGGQHCGIMPTGVKVVHVPSGLTASCTCERSQMLNRNTALAMIEWGLETIEWQDN